MMREGESSAGKRGKAGAVTARSEHPERRQSDLLRHGAHGTERMTVGKAVRSKQNELLKALEEIVVRAAVLARSQRVGGDGVGAGRAAQPEIDAPGIERLQHLEPLGHHQRGMVRQHHSAGADAHVPGHRRDLPDHDLGCGACDRGQVVVLGHPITREAERFGEPREIDGIA